MLVIETLILLYLRTPSGQSYIYETPSVQRVPPLAMVLLIVIRWRKELFKFKVLTQLCGKNYWEASTIKYWKMFKSPILFTYFGKISCKFYLKAKSLVIPLTNLMDCLIYFLNICHHSSLPCFRLYWHFTPQPQLYSNMQSFQLDGFFSCLSYMFLLAIR